MVIKYIEITASRIMSKMSYRYLLVAFLFQVLGMVYAPQIQAMQRQINQTMYTESINIHKKSHTNKLKKIISVNLKNATLQNGLELIAKKVDLKLVYSDNILPLNKRISLHKKRIKVEDALWKLLANTGFRFAVSSHNHLVLIKSKNEKNGRGVEAVSGKVIGASSSEGLPGVNIKVKGTTMGTFTNAEGEYELNVPTLQDTLIFSFVGYERKVVPIDGRNTVNVALKAQVISGKEMVVVGYGTQTRNDITSSISSVSSDEITKTPAATVGNALSGRVPGLQTIQRSGAPGSDAPEMYLRGVASLSTGRSGPIFVLDGVIQRDARSIMQLDPDNIKSVSVLKDASATAVYGVEGANGAVVVETKRGERGPTKISVKMTGGFQTPVKTPDFVNSYTYVSAYDEAQLNDGVAPNQVRYPPEVLEGFKSGNPIIYPDLDLIHTFTKPRAFQSRTNVNVSGGTDDVRYYVAAGYLKQDGFFRTFDTDYDFNPTFDRYNFRSNLDIDVTPTTELSLTAGGRYGSRVLLRGVGRTKTWWKLYWSSPFGGAGVDDQGRVINTGNYYIPGPKKNAIADVYGNGYDKINRTNLNLNLSGTQKLNFITDGLSFQMKGAYNIYYTRNIYRSGNVPIYTPYFHTDVDNSAPGDSSIVYQKSGSYSTLGYNEDYNRDRDWYIEARLNYDQSFGRHNVKGLLMYNQRKNFYPNQNITPHPYVGIPRGLVSTVGRVNYNYDDRYLAEFSMGYNGSENFARGQRFGFFPAVSGGWIITNEPYMPDIPFLSYLKLRASYGIVGNDTGIGRFLYLPDQYHASSGGYNLGYDIPNDVPGASEGALGNPEVTWERSEKQNYGIDLRLFNSKLDISFDYFHEHRSNILTTLNTVPDYVAANLPAVNIGEVENKGYEAQATWEQHMGDFFYSIGGNVSFARNHIIFMDEVQRDEPYLRRTGKPVGQNFGWVFDRWYTEDDFQEGSVNIVSPFPAEPGYPKFKDLNGDGVINSNDKRAIGYPEYPEYTFGANLQLGYKNVDFSMQWAAATNVSRKLGISPFATPFGGNGQFSMMQYMWDGRWTPEKGQDATYPKLTLENRQPVATNSTITMRDASYIRLKNAQIGYSFNPAFLQNIGLKNMRVYLTGYNLLTFSRMHILDPEQSANAQQVEYPIMKVYDLGINIDF